VVPVITAKHDVRPMLDAARAVKTTLTSMARLH